MIQKKCAYCSFSFETENRDKIYCSRKCAMNPEIIKKRKEECILRYGSENGRNTDSSKLIWKSNRDTHWRDIERFCRTCSTGFFPREVTQFYCSRNCARNTEEILSKTKKTKLERYGNENYVNIEKHRETCIERYGGPNISSRNTFGKDLSKENLEHLYSGMKLTSYEIADLLKVTQRTIIDYLKKYNISARFGYSQSSFEKRICLFLKDINVGCIENSRKIIPPLELDIYISDYNLAIEVNGHYWHSDRTVDKNYHLNKYTQCLKKNIHLIQIFDFEFNKEQKLKSLISNYLNKNSKIYARNCKLYIPSKEEVRDFLDKFHLQGYVRSSIDIGLKYNDEMIAVMTFGKPRFNKKYDFELLRLAFKQGVYIIGGSEKMFSCFLRSNKDKSIISYCDRRFFKGDVYKRLGFSYLGESKPSYVYYKQGLVFSRYKCQKHKLIKFLKIFDKEKSEYQNMTENGYVRLWDAGNGLFEFNKRGV